MIEEFSNPFVEKIKNAVEDENFLFVYHNCGQITPLMDKIDSLDAKAYSISNAIDIEDALKGLSSDSLVIGNIDPAGVLRGGAPESVKAETLALLERCSKYPNFIIASGCDIPPATPLANLDAFFEAVAQFYSK